MTTSSSSSASLCALRAALATRAATRVLRAHWELVETVAWIPASMPHRVLEEGEGISVVAEAVATASTAVQLAVVVEEAVRV